MFRYAVFTCILLLFISSNRYFIIFQKCPSDQRFGITLPNLINLKACATNVKNDLKPKEGTRVI